ncbi:endogenous retrovirus group K member 8 Gag polyprotein-like [Falco biarmicus]|uniref:endogenous retrovirus group K member 8 Gag polyprotein-like n=1 Tax=Falco cherrug TaxID=345164 RepID=UPI00247A2BA2|nr:endogenous retrovirus group K member 8 Gag polyprotein-like [Falco cherrug]XP_056179166.1 endogenous retrovirus group K member 8 Gag polyprotein-like [Falco biarmicus]
MFEKEWKRLAVEEANRHQDPDIGDPLYGLRADMLTGQGLYSTTQVQLQYPIQMHQLAQTLAHRALLSVPDKKKPASYTTVCQGTTEPYGQFVDCLSAALKDNSDLPVDLQEHLFRSLAFEGANPRIRVILATLPQGSPLDEMLIRATRAEQNNQVAAFTAALREQGHIIAAALTNHIGGHRKGNNGKSGFDICYRCGESGHVRCTCSKTVWCHKCNLDKHATAVCRYNRSGNMQCSTSGLHAKTQVQAPTTQMRNVVSYTSASHLPGGASGWTWQLQ